MWDLILDQQLQWAVINELCKCLTLFNYPGVPVENHLFGGCYLIRDSAAPIYLIKGKFTQIGTTFDGPTEWSSGKLSCQRHSNFWQQFLAFRKYINNFKPFGKGPSEVSGITGERKIRFDTNIIRDYFKESLHLYYSYGYSYYFLNGE